MTLQTRILLLVTSLLIVAVVSTAGILTWTTQNALLEQTEDDGRIIAELLARSAGFAEQVPQDVEVAIGDQMIVGATITAHLVAVAEAAGFTPEQIRSMLESITATTVLDEFWVTDEIGHAYITTEDVDFTFHPDPQVQPQASVFWPLLTGEETTVVQAAQQREIDEGIFKYVGVGGVDQSRIVELGTNADLLERLADEMGPARLAEEIVASGSVDSIRILDHNFTTIAYSGDDSDGSDVALDWRQINQDLRGAITAGETMSHQGDTALEVVAPVFSADERVVGSVLVSLPTTRVNEALRENLLVAILVAAAVLVMGALASVAVARWVTKPVDQLTTAAASVETGSFDPDSLEQAASRRDGLGQLARVFQTMAREVRAREERLRAQVKELKIEIDRTQEARQVAEIVDTDYFQDLQSRARGLRKRSDSKRQSPDQPKET